MAYVYKPRAAKPNASGSSGSTGVVGNNIIQTILSKWDTPTQEDMLDIQHDTDFRPNSTHRIYKHPGYRGKINKGAQYERLLFHGTRSASVQAILQSDMDINKANSGMFGDGIYFADKWKKSFNYTDGKFMFIYAVRDDQARFILDEVDRQHLLIRVTTRLNRRELKKNALMPMIHAVQSEKEDLHHFLYNDEWCVYDPTLFRLAFIICC